MEQAEFERRFAGMWRERYSQYDPETDHWTRERDDKEAMQQCRLMLLEYAREVRRVGISRRSKNKAQRLFDEMGIDPASITLDVGGAETVRHTGEAEGDPERTGKTRIMYIERKAGSLTGEAHIGRVTYSKTGRTLHYGGLSFRSLKGEGFKSNYRCVETGEEYWISGPKRDGSDRLYGERLPVHIDEDVREEYWTCVRRCPQLKDRERT